MRELQPVPIQTEYLRFRGGLDTETPPLSVPSGSLSSCLNYEPDSLGGYRRPAGYERFDGRARPSDATYTLVAATLTTTPAFGALLTIGAVTCFFVQLIDGGFVATGATGTIPGSTTINAPGPVAVGTTAPSSLLGLSLTNEQESGLIVGSANVYRALIQPVPGSGPVRGVNFYNGVLYAFRDNAGGTAGAMYQASASGWTLVALGEVVNFTNANASVNDGDVLTQGAVTATIRRVVLETGALGGANTGRLFITGRAGGNFSAAAATSTGGGTLTLGGAQTAVTLPAGGRYEFENFAFTGAATSFRMYGVNGVGPAFEFDGTTFVTIDTKGATNSPKFIRCNRGYLYLAQVSSVLNSSVGNPYRFVAAEGASEIAVGDVVTGLASLPGEAVGIFSRNKSQALTGATPTNWSLQVIRGDVGALPYTVQTMSDTFMLDDRGVISVSSSQNYGNFNDASLSRRVKRLIDQIRSKVVTSHVNRERGHYKLLMNDGSTLTMGYDGGQVTGFCPGQLGFVPNCAYSGEDATGKERIFYGSTSGYVFEMNRGSTFDGDDFESFLKVFYVASRSPELRKRYRRMTLELSLEQFISMRYQAEFSYGDVAIETHNPGILDQIKASGAVGGSAWDSSNWDQFIWDSSEIARPSLSIEGTGINVAISFYSKTKLDFGHVLSGVILHYTPRRLQRT